MATRKDGLGIVHSRHHVSATLVMLQVLQCGDQSGLRASEALDDPLPAAALAREDDNRHVHAAVTDRKSADEVGSELKLDLLALVASS